MATNTTCNIAPCEGKRFSTLRGYAQHCGVAHKDVDVERLATADGISKLTTKFTNGFTKLSKCQDCKRCFLCVRVPERHDCKFEDVKQKERAAQVAASKKRALDNKTSEERDQIAKKDAERMQQVRDNRTDEERERVAQQDAERKQRERAAIRGTNDWWFEQTRKGTIYCDIDAHLNWCTSTSRDSYNHEYEMWNVLRHADKWVLGPHCDGIPRPRVIHGPGCACTRKGTTDTDAQQATDIIRDLRIS